MSEQEQAFFEWWQKVELHKEHYNLRMAFDAGYEASQRERAK